MEGWKAERKKRTKLKDKLRDKRRFLINQRRRRREQKELEREIMQVETEQELLEEAKIKAYTYNALAKNGMLGESPSKHFYLRNKIFSHSEIRALEWRGRVVTEPREIIDAGGKYYQELYSVKETDPEAQRKVLNTLRDAIPEKQSRAIAQTITKTEVRKAIGKAASGKSPGVDSIPAEVYKALLKGSKKGKSPYVVKILTRLFNIVIDKGVMPEN